jgi:hypothetical protein
VCLFSASAGVSSRSAYKPVLILAIALAWPALPRADPPAKVALGRLIWSRCFEVELDGIEKRTGFLGIIYEAPYYAMLLSYYMPCHATFPPSTLPPSHLSTLTFPSAVNRPMINPAAPPPPNPINVQPQLDPVGGDPQLAVNVVIRLRSSPGTRCWAWARACWKRGKRAAWVRDPLFWVSIPRSRI